MSNDKLEVTSEIYAETDYNSSKIVDGKRISQFTFIYPCDDKAVDDDDGGNINGKHLKTDKDGDLVIPRKRFGTINIEHHQSTELSLVGLQVWRGALLLADFIFANRKQFSNKRIIELGSGCGLTGIVASIYAKHVLFTDINIGGILNLIEQNIKRNLELLPNSNNNNNTKLNINVMELDFKNPTEWSTELNDEIKKCNIILAADVIYDDDLTEAFINTIDKLLLSSPTITIYIALEKRYVFTMNELDSVAPCYEHFLRCIEKIRWLKMWKFESIPLEFPQYFQYERVKQLVLLKITL